MNTDKSIYDDLVKDDDDIVGMITYAFYKRHKLEYIENTFGKVKVTDGDIELFKRTITSKAKAGFQLSAVQALKKATDIVIDEHRAILLDTVLKETLAANKVQNAHIDELVERQRQVLTSFENNVKGVLTQHIVDSSSFSWKAFWIGVISNFAASILWLALVLLILSSVDDSKKEEVFRKGQKIFLNRDVDGRDSTAEKESRP